MSDSCRGCWITDGAAPHTHTHTHYIDREISIYWRISSNTPDDDQLETKHRRYYIPLLLLIPVLLTTDHHRVTTTDRWGQSVEELVGSTGADQWTSSDELFLLPSSTHHTSTNDMMNSNSLDQQSAQHTRHQYFDICSSVIRHTLHTVVNCGNREICDKITAKLLLLLLLLLTTNNRHIRTWVWRQHLALLF